MTVTSEAETAADAGRAGVQQRMASRIKDLEHPATIFTHT
jgi:hypothetical protein